MADKMRVYDDVKDLVEDEIDKIIKQGDLNDTTLMHLDKLVDIAKDLCEIEEKDMEMESGYSQRMYPHYYDNGNSMMDRGNSYRRDSMGRYSRGRMNSYDNSNGYSRHGDDMADRLGRMMSEAQTEREREAIRAALERI